VSAPVITEQPVARVIDIGGSVEFNVAADGVDLSYQWQRNGKPIDGATGDSLDITNAQRTDAGTYSVVVSNTIGKTTSLPATLTLSGGADFVHASGGGAPSLLWLGALLVLGLTRLLRRAERSTDVAGNTGDAGDRA